MKDTNPAKDLQEIRKMMEDSSKFLSLSGLSGVWAGVIALAGAFTVRQIIDHYLARELHYVFSGRLDESLQELTMQLWMVAFGVLVLALGGGIIITAIKAKKNGQKVFSPIALKMVLAVMTPMLFGGIFVIGLFYHKVYLLIPPAMLLFYGMALLNASRYAHIEVKYLALSEMLLGCLLMFDLDRGLIYWAIGFGVLHIVYGALMWYKYDKKKPVE